MILLKQEYHSFVIIFLFHLGFSFTFLTLLKSFHYLKILKEIVCYLPFYHLFEHGEAFIVTIDTLVNKLSIDTLLNLATNVSQKIL